MNRILLDETIPFGLSRLLGGFHFRHVRDTGWTGSSHGDLIAVAEAAGFDAMITADKNLRYQQNLAGRRLALIVIESNNWPLVRRNARAVSRAQPGGFDEVAFDTRN